MTSHSALRNQLAYYICKQYDHRDYIANIRGVVFYRPGMAEALQWLLGSHQYLLVATLSIVEMFIFLVFRHMKSLCYILPSPYIVWRYLKVKFNDITYTNIPKFYAVAEQFGPKPYQ